MDKIINHVVLTFSRGLKVSETPSGKPLMHKDEYNLGRKCIWNYKLVVGIFSYLHGSTRQYISMTVHQCARFCNILRLVHKHAVKRIAKYLSITSTYVDIPDRNRRLITHSVVYGPNIEKVSSVTQILHFLVGGLKKFLIMQKMSCRIQDTQ